MIRNGFKNVVAIALETDIKIKQLANLGPAPSAAPAGGAAKTETKAAAPKVEEKKDEPEEVDMGGMFGDDEEW
jgi:ribosomal protein L12E/L44/L45/RPP1/RPP2